LDHIILVDHYVGQEALRHPASISWQPWLWLSLLHILSCFLATHPSWAGDARGFTWGRTPTQVRTATSGGVGGSARGRHSASRLPLGPPDVVGGMCAGALPCARAPCMARSWRALGLRAPPCARRWTPQGWRYAPRCGLRCGLTPPIVRLTGRFHAWPPPGGCLGRGTAPGGARR